MLAYLSAIRTTLPKISLAVALRRVLCELFLRLHKTLVPVLQSAFTYIARCGHIAVWLSVCCTYSDYLFTRIMFVILALSMLPTLEVDGCSGDPFASDSRITLARSDSACMRSYRSMAGARGC